MTEDLNNFNNKKSSDNQNSFVAIIDPMIIYNNYIPDAIAQFSSNSNVDIIILPQYCLNYYKLNIDHYHTNQKVRILNCKDFRDFISKIKELISNSNFNYWYFANDITKSEKFLKGIKLTQYYPHFCYTLL